MAETDRTEAVSTPWHLWVVGIVALLWNAIGAFDYVMTQTHNEAYLAGFTAEQLDYFYGFPSWAIATWAIAIWGSVLGTLLLLLRKRQAAEVYLASLVAMVINTIYCYFLSPGLEIMGTMGAAFSAVIFLVCVGLCFYSRTMADRGVLA